MSLPFNAPMTDVAFASLDREQLHWVAQHDQKQLERERAGLAPWVADRVTVATHAVAKMMGEWEIAVNVISEGWCDTDRLLLDDYKFALDERAELEFRFSSSDSEPPVPLVRALVRLDERFLGATTQEGDSGAGVLKEHLAPMAKRPPFWLWDRRPRVLPW